MSDYKNPTPTVDIIVDSGEAVVLIERANPPRGWALPGGFVDEGESVEEAARRELREETGLDVELQELFYVYSHPSRDRRQHNLSVVFIARSEADLHPGDDARDARRFPWASLPDELAFDHREILDDYLRYRQSGCRPTPSEYLERHE